ncbi:hypothetical protein jhhlp_008050 [Lomentospora prolificans]|uniref:Glycosyltransferase family 71 protein n=1 Tax=Lomentospora prolificans TaxID=41688 RepID=A0A2N3MZC3_9PEZI|nr:hypothetical protein jhhlp_008050 [Lomentospora prolificans]
MLTEEEIANIERTAESFVDSPIRPPYKEQYGELGQRAQQLRNWMTLAEASSNLDEKKRLARAAEKAAPSLFPFLRDSPRNPHSETPLANLVETIQPGSKGIVLPTGSGTLRYAYHLIASLREVIKCTLPIEIAYAGDHDLTPADRDRLQSRFTNIRFVDVLQVFSDETLDLRNGGWASKPFAALASSFEEVILVDADAVFLQAPEALFMQTAYTSTGAYLFHDRLLWKGAFRERHEWWESQVVHPSAALNKSLSFTQDYAEEGDSGVVVVDKHRADVLVGLLHTAWQNSKDVRETTYSLGYGDKETWWFGLELTGALYAFEDHYASIVGWPSENHPIAAGMKGDAKICSFVIAHVDDQGKLLWYNGSLLKNKKVDKKTFAIPTHWMVDGTWSKGPSRQEMSCMAGETAQELSAEERSLLDQSVRLAKKLDDEFGLE